MPCVILDVNTCRQISPSRQTGRSLRVHLCASECLRLRVPHVWSVVVTSVTCLPRLGTGILYSDSGGAGLTPGPLSHVCSFQSLKPQVIFIHPPLFLHYLAVVFSCICLIFYQCFFLAVCRIWGTKLTLALDNERSWEQTTFLDFSFACVSPAFVDLHW